MLETAERLVTEEGQPAVQQFLLLVGGLRAMTRRPGHRRGANQVLDSYLLRSLAVAGYAPSFSALRPLRRRGAAPAFSPSAGGVLCPDCRVPGLGVTRRAGRSTLLGALLDRRLGRRRGGRPARAARGRGPGGGLPALAPRARPAVAGVRRALRLSRL